MKIRITTFIVLCIFLFGCNNDEIDQLTKENEVLKSQLEDCKYGPDKMISELRTYFSEKKYDKAKSHAALINEKYPGTKEDIESKTIIAVIEEQIKKEENERKQIILNATKNLRVHSDEISGTTYYFDKYSPKYINTYSTVYAYIGDSKNKKPSLRLKIIYVDNDWLFVEKFTIKADDDVFHIEEKRYGEIERDNGSGGIWEWLDREVTEREMTVIQSIIESKNAVIRFKGKHYHSDKKISEAEKKALSNIVLVYEDMVESNSDAN